MTSGRARSARADPQQGVSRGQQDLIARSVQPPSAARRTYVLDTSVLLADPGALTRFAEHEVVLPVVVITELEGKRNHPELGYFARAALRSLDDLRVVHGRLDEPVAIGTEGGTLRVELNHTDPDVAALRLPAGRQRHPDPRRRAQPGQRGPPGHARLQGPAAADQGLGRRARTPRSTAPRGSATPATPG